MKLALYIILPLMFLFGISSAQYVEVYFENPGALGMQSAYGIHTLQPEHLYFGQNIDVTSIAGQIGRRKGLINYGANTQAVYGAFGYHNGELDHSLVIGSYDYDSLYDIGMFCYTDTFGTDLSDNKIYQAPFPYGRAYHDWVQIGDFAIHADGQTTPIVFTTSSPKFLSQSAMDATRFRPRTISMGLEAPGQPRAGIYDSTGPLNGYFQYAFAYSGGKPGIPSTIVRPENKCVYLTNIPSAISTFHMEDTLYILRKEVNGLGDWYVIDTLFKPQDSLTAPIYVDTNRLPFDTTWVVHTFFYNDTAWRDTSDWGAGSADSVWYDTLTSCDTCGPILYWEKASLPYLGYVDRVSPNADHCNNYWSYWGNGDSITADYTFWKNDTAYTIDSLIDWDAEGDSCVNIEWSSAGSAYFDSVVGKFDTVWIDTNATLWTGSADTIPGQPINLNGSDSLSDYCRIAYSRYDPILNIESPIGPSIACGYDSTALGIMDTVVIIPPARISEPEWIRIYQTVVNPAVVGGGDTTTWYCIMQGRIKDIIGKDSAVYLVYSDTAVANGLDTADVVCTTATGSALDYPYHFPRTILGNVIVQPPYIYDNQVPFSDVDYVSSRIVGIGDPIAPERLYYSERNTDYTNVFNWHPYNYVDINEGVSGEIVAIERAEGFGQDALYVFKRNAIYLIDFSSGENIQLIESNVGPVSRNAIVKYGKVVYFLASDMRIYSLYGINVEDISRGVKNYVDSLFENEVSASTYCNAFRLGQSIKFFDTSNYEGAGLSYNTEYRTWSIESYGNDSNYVPIGSITYDSSSSGIMSGFPTTVLYSDSSVPLRIEVDTAYDWGTVVFPWSFQLPFVGDGENLWSVAKIQMTINSISSYTKIRTAVYNENHSLRATKIDTLRAIHDGNFTFDMPDNQGKYLSVKFYFLMTDTYGSEPAVPMRNDIEVKDVRLFLRAMGKDNDN